MIKYVIWGTGIRGRAVYEFLGEQKVGAFIDNNLDLQGKEVLGKPVISYEDYKNNFSDFFIIVSMIYYKELVQKLESDGEGKFLVLSEAPQECYGWGDKNILKDLPFQIDKKLPCIVWGINLFSILLLEELVNRGMQDVCIVPHDTMSEKRRKAVENSLPGWYRNNVDTEYKANIFLTVETEKKLGNSDSNIYNAYDFSHQLHCYYNSNIAEFKNRYKGKRCFIVATGPSLKISDLDKLYVNEEYAFSMNKIFYSFKDTVWRPDFYLAQDRMIIQNNIDEINKLELEHIFLCDTYQGNVAEKIMRFHLSEKDYFNIEKQFFSENVAWGVYGGGTVTYACIQFAIYMGFTEIYLLGVDFSSWGKKGPANHFYKNEKEKLFEVPKEYVQLTYETAKKYADEHGIKIYNATRGGELEVFERTDFDSLFT